MAIKELDTNHYYKIDFDECSIRGTKVYVRLVAYLTQKDRETEKSRAENVNKFHYAAVSFADSLYGELLQKVELGGLDKDAIVDEDGVIKSEYPELKKLQKRVNDILEFINEFNNSLYCHDINNAPKPPEMPFSKEELCALNYDAEWLLNPVKVVNSAEIYCGEYGGEDISHEFYYNRLKTVMNDKIINV